MVNIEGKKKPPGPVRRMGDYFGFGGAGTREIFA